MSALLLWSLPGLPIVAGAAVLLTRRRPALVAIVVAVATLALAVVAAVTRPASPVTLFAGIRSGLAVDGLSSVMIVTVAAVALAVLVFAAGEMREARFFGLMLIFVGAMVLTVTATDLVLLLMGWELMGAMSYALIGFWWREPGNARSASVAFVTTRAGDLGLYFAAGAAFLGGSLSFADLPVSGLVASGIVLAALGKSAQLPFSFWLSRAMAGPSPVSALLHSATMVAAGAYLLLRVQPLLAATGWAATLVAWVGAVTALLLGAVALAQRDLKQLLAASTCAQLGFMVLAAGVGSVAGGSAHLVAHAAVKSLLFLGAGAWLTALGTKDLAALRGAARAYRLVGVTFGVGGLALAGVPPLSLWVTKDAILASVHSPALYAVSLGGALLAAAYAAKAVLAVWQPGDPAGTGRLSALQRAPLPVLALAAAGFGIVGLPTLFGGWARLVGDPAAPGPSMGELALSGTLAAAAVLATALVRRGGAVQGWWAGWLGLEAVALAVVWRPLEAAAGVCAWFDDRVIDGAVRAVPRLGMAAARIARKPFELGVDGVVSAVAATTARLGTLARRPQTGQVHTYFAQAAVVFLLLALVVVVVR